MNEVGGLSRVECGRCGHEHLRCVQVSGQAAVTPPWTNSSRALATIRATYRTGAEVPFGQLAPADRRQNDGEQKGGDRSA
jgi:hypothetical protein